MGKGQGTINAVAFFLSFGFGGRRGEGGKGRERRRKGKRGKKKKSDDGKQTKRTKKTTLSLSSLFSPSRRRQLTIVASWSLAHGPVCILAAMTVHSDLASAACMPERGESLKKKRRVEEREKE